MSVLEHFMGDQPCPTCRKPHDPASGYCSACEPELSLWRVTSMTDEWLTTPETAPPSPQAIVSRRNVAAQVERFLGPEVKTILVERHDS